MDFPAVIPLVEVQRTHHTFLHAAHPDAALLKLTHARRLIKRNELDWLPTETSLITTSTVNDNSLAQIDWETELDIVSTLTPEYHIPTDYSIYSDMPREERLEAIRTCMDGASWLDSQLSTNTTVIPLIKGETRHEREICYDTIDAIGAPFAAFYATQYFSSGNGNNINALVERLAEIQHERPDLDVFVIGLLAESYVSRLPVNVHSVAGQNQWRSRITPTTLSETEIKRIWENLVHTISNTLPHNQF